MPNLNIIFDCSGSFAIRGKRSLLVYAFRMLENIRQARDLSGVKFSYFYWQKDEVGELSDEEILLQPDGSSDFDVLVDFLSEKAAQGEPSLLMTDGCYDSWGELSQLSPYDKLFVSVILMGADADWQMAGTSDLFLYPLVDLPTAVRNVVAYDMRQ